MIDLVGLCASDKRVRRFLIKRKKPLLARSLGRSKGTSPESLCLNLKLITCFAQMRPRYVLLQAAYEPEPG